MRDIFSSLCLLLVGVAWAETNGSTDQEVDHDCLARSVHSNGTAQITVCLASQTPNPSNQTTETHVRLINTGRSGACDVRVAVAGLRENVTRLWPDWINDTAATLPSSQPGVPPVASLYPMPVRPREVLHVRMETRTPMANTSSSSASSKRSALPSSSPGPVTVVGLTPCAAAASRGGQGQEEESAATEEEGDKQQGGDGSASVTGGPLVSPPATDSFAAAPPTTTTTDTTTTATNTTVSPDAAAAAPHRRRRPANNSYEGLEEEMVPVLNGAVKEGWKCINQTAVGEDGPMVNNKRPLQVMWCVPKKPYVWVEPRGKRRFVKLDGTVTNLGSEGNEWACELRFELTNMEAKPVATWPEWFPVSTEGLEPGVSVSVGANTRKKKGYPSLRLVSFKRCPEDPGAE